MKLGQEEETGNELEQVIAMLERSEIDYVHQYEGEDGSEDEELDLDELGSYIDVNDTVRMFFDEEGNLLEINPIPN